MSLLSASDDLIEMPSQEETESVATINYEALEAEIKRLTSEIRAEPPEHLREETANVQSNESWQHALNLILIQYGEGEITEEEELEELRLENLSDEFREEVRRRNALTKEADRLKAMAEPEKRKAVAEKLRNTLNELNWGAVLDFYSTDIEDRLEISGVIVPINIKGFLSVGYKTAVDSIRKLEDPSGKVSYDEAEAYLDQFRRVLEGWKAYGFVDEPQSSGYREARKTPIEDGVLLKTLVDCEESASKIFEMHKLFRNPDLSGRALKFRQSKFLSSPLSSLKEAVLAEGADALLLNDGFLIAVQAKASQLINEVEEREYFDTLAKYSRESDPYSLVNNIEIEGIEAGPNQKLVIDVDTDIRASLAQMIPPAYLRRIKIISHSSSIRSITPENEGIEDDAFIGLGNFFPIWDQKNLQKLIESEIKIFVRCTVDEQASEDEVAFYQYQFMQVLYHELGHRIHTELSPELMEKWLTINADGLAVTEYVEHARTLDERNNVGEDFAESFILFHSSPMTLFKMSPERFRFFYAFNKEYLTPDQFGILENKLDSHIRSHGFTWSDCIIDETS